jgi:hypothetical protein
MFSGLAPIADMRDGMPDFRLVAAAVILYSADGSVEDAKYALGNLLGRLQVWLPCVHRYAKVWVCVRPPEIARVEPYSIEPLRIFTLAKCVGVREDVAAV